MYKLRILGATVVNQDGDLIGTVTSVEDTDEGSLVWVDDEETDGGDGGQEIEPTGPIRGGVVYSPSFVDKRAVGDSS